ncbi:MAG: sulfur reduction protein DsrE [Deltaproteobacteria bacterium]|nr:sulfur reduction protein DsrE [Deltaproteobacteria bacterium]
MADYMLIASRDPFSTNDVPTYYALARDLKERGNTVTLFLVQNGVLPARPSAASDLLTSLSELGITVLADEFSLRERGIPANGLAPGVAAAPLDLVVDHLESGAKTLWN